MIIVEVINFSFFKSVIIHDCVEDDDDDENEHSIQIMKGHLIKIVQEHFLN